MRVTVEHREALAARVRPLDTPERRDAYRRRDIPRGELVKDIDRRYRNDLLYAARVWEVWGDDDPNYSDAHLLTAMGSIVAPLEAERCPRCGGMAGTHGAVHTRHGNGGGSNTPCPMGGE